MATAASPEPGSARLAALPVVSSLSPTSGPATGGTIVTITGSGLTAATAVRFGITPATAFTVNSDTRITATSPAGAGTVSVAVTTPGGTSTGSVTFTYTVVTAPTLTALSPSSGPASGGTPVTLTGTGLGGATAVHFGATAVAFTVISSSQITATAPAGTGGVAVNVTTPSGTSNNLTYVYVQAPTVTTVSPTQGPSVGGNTVTIAGAGFTGATSVLFGGFAAASFTVVSPTQITAGAPSEAPGAAQILVTTPEGTSGPGVYYFFIATPSLRSLDPSQGPEAGGNTVAINGTGLELTSAVRFGAASPTPTVVSADQITVTAPPGTGSVSVDVTTPGGTSNNLTYSYVPAPVITTLSPTSGPEAGGNTVTLTGTHFASAVAVRFGATSVAFTVLSDTQLTAVAPAGAGNVPVTVTTIGGTSGSRLYAYVPAPG